MILISGKIAVAEGHIQTDIKFGIGLFRPAKHYIYIDNHSFQISNDQKISLMEGREYRVYHTLHTLQFLGAILLVNTANNPILPIPLSEPLTSREYEILQLIAAGLTNRQIGVQLSLSVNTIKMYTTPLYAKLGVNRRTEAVARAKALNLF